MKISSTTVPSPPVDSSVAKELSGYQRGGSKRPYESDSSGGEESPLQRKSRPNPSSRTTVIEAQLRETLGRSQTLDRSGGSTIQENAIPQETVDDLNATNTSPKEETTEVLKLGSDRQHIISPSEQYASRSIHGWAKETQKRLRQLPNYLHLTRRDEDDNFTNERELQLVCQNLAYELYADVETKTNALSHVEQEQFLHALEELSAGGTCEVTAQGMGENDPINGRSPGAALKYSVAGAAASHFHVMTQDPKLLAHSNARLTLNLSPAYVIETSRSLVPLLTQFADVINQFKIIAPKEQGTRTESIVIYLNKTNIKRAEALAAQLNSNVNAAAWESHIPLGMHPIQKGISYAEFSEHADTDSFGEDRTGIVADALLYSIDYESPIEGELDKILAERGYLADNPALIART